MMPLPGLEDQSSELLTLPELRTAICEEIYANTPLLKNHVHSLRICVGLWLDMNPFYTYSKTSKKSHIWVGN